MNITLYSGFSKRRNSTLRPGGGTGKSVVLKDNTSMMRPAFLLSSVDWSWNYCSWGSRYYYVTDIVQEANNMFRVECELDELATFKDQIGGYSTLISRSDTFYDGTVMDTIYPTKSDPYTLSASASSAGLFTANRDSGAVVMGIIGHGGLQFVVMSVPAFRSLCAVLFPVITQPPDVYFASTISQALVGGLNTVMESIVMIKWMPIEWSTAVSQLGLTRASEIYIGQLKWNVSGQVDVYVLTGNTIVMLSARQITFPDRDWSRITQRGDWLNMQPFAQYTLLAPPFGEIAVDGSFLVPAQLTIQATVRVEILSGNAQLDLTYYDSGFKSLGRYNTCVAYDVKAGGAGAPNYGGGLAAAASAIASYVGEDYAGAAASIIGAASAMIPQSGHMGAGISGPTPDIDAPWYAESTYYDPIEENRAELGRPAGRILTIGSLSGYVRTADAKLAIPGHEAEMVKVNEMLNGGIFYE